MTHLLIYYSKINVPDEQSMVLWMILLYTEVNFLPVILKSICVRLRNNPGHTALNIKSELCLACTQLVIGDSSVQGVDTLHAWSIT